MKVYKSYAKVNIFLKITGVRDGYHTLASRFMVVKDLYDEVDFFQKDKKESNVSALEDLNNQLIKARSALKISEEKLSLVASKTHVLGNEISQMSDARDKVKTLQGSLQSTQKKLTLSADKVQYL